MRSFQDQRSGGRARTCRTQLVVAAVVFAALIVRRESISGWGALAIRRPPPLFSRDALPPGTNPWFALNHLIVVCGHAVLTTHHEVNEETVVRDEAWSLEPFQRGQVPTFLSHIRKGIKLAAADTRSLLLFSGGETRQGAGPRSEAKSYWEVADAMGWHGKPAVRERALTEDHAHDSFENMLYSLCRFREVTGRYPEQLTVVSFGFKEARFRNMHRRAIRWPERTFRYAGVDPPGNVDVLRDAEHLNSVSLFGSDPYGCLGALARKRLGRNPFHSTSGYPKQCPELDALFSYCSSEVFSGELPWAMY